MIKALTILTFCISIVITDVYPQCKLTAKDRTYDAICFEKLYRGTFTIGRTAEIAIAKDGKRGLFILKLPWSDTNLKGRAYIYLEDNTVITLIYRSNQWKVNGELFGQFNLTESEILKLKESNISAIRFWTCPFQGIDDCGDASEYYNKTFTDDIHKRAIEKVDFPKLVRGLFQ